MITNFKKFVFFTLLLLTLIELTFFLFFATIWLIGHYLEIPFSLTDVFILLVFVANLVGYAGIWYSIFLGKNKRLKFILTLIGLISFICSISIIGGFSAWYWFISFNEPVEWGFVALPLLTYTTAVIANYKARKKIIE